MKKILDRWWIFICWGIAIFLVLLMIASDLSMTIKQTITGEEYMKKVGNNVNPIIENIKIHADGNEYEVVIIDGEFKNVRYDNERLNFKTRMFEGRAVINYYILKKGCEPLDEDYNLWCFYLIIPVKRDSVLSEYHIDGKAINENIFYHQIYHNFIRNFIDDYLEDSDKERYTGWSCNNFERQDYKCENTIVFSDKGQVEGGGELLLTYTSIVNEEKIKVNARLVIESLKGDKDLYITTERIKNND
ncbi:hypothetical protein [Oceanirhabdus sp. W0125-5]|uniref:hypothetical protein n=1 Tax=Oceanirhabdus sp. W0125-5 TaxID=2999116 RepID=UPI0022F2FB72|nr:hypothetical protein [Oceanirhabdus sp. W0125-5]WBW96501.1 hypothetical protein OW730_22815 [Oceanirhabdus sp. W0125-5]